ncbi:MAG: hypothetical protein KDA81_16280 [Planctomycetaceae bacterium]|nr:hypothetical protein [Planctomycetaceae bacterium]
MRRQVRTSAQIPADKGFAQRREEMLTFHPMPQAKSVLTAIDLACGIG